MPAQANRGRRAAGRRRGTADRAIPPRATSSSRSPSASPQRQASTAAAVATDGNTADDFKRQIRHMLDTGPTIDDWPEVEAAGELLAATVAAGWKSAVTRGAGKKAKLEVDVVCSGGGWRNLYCGGGYSVLLSLERQNVIEIRRAAGASSGALAAGCFGCRCPPRDWYRLHDPWWVLHAQYGLRLYNPVMRGFIRAFYPPDAAERCTREGTRFSLSDCHGFPRQWPQVCVWLKTLMVAGITSCFSRYF